jgi:tetratricopeptide (TPR) repeat protein
MECVRISGFSVLVLVTIIAGRLAAAESAGQADLDKATELKVTAESVGDLEKVAQLCESALRKGLDEGNQKFAKQLLASTLYQHADRLSAPIFGQGTPDRRMLLLWNYALKDLERAIEVTPQFGEAHLLIARLHALPGGDPQRAEKAANAAVSLFEKEPANLAAALVVRAQFREEAAERLKDYDKAIELDPANADAWQARAATYMEEGKFDKAVADLKTLIKRNEKNVSAHFALGEALLNMEKYDEALQQIDAGIKLKPDAPLGYTLRARVHLAKLKDDDKAATDAAIRTALEDLNKALKVEPRDIRALLIRASLLQEQGKLQAARDDIERVLILRPGLVQAILARSRLAASEGKLSDAIADMKSVLENDPENVQWRLMLAGYYIQDKRPSKAIDIFTKILAGDEDNSAARQARADTFLSIGKHADAIADFEIALKQEPNNDGILNNFAWVLATSPDDKLRNGKRAIELATKACEVTKYKKAHILSTLAAAFAETGDFQTAQKWSRQAVELGAAKKDVDEQLKQELESYKKSKPWREKQTIEEKADPVQERRSSFEA